MVDVSTKMHEDFDFDAAGFDKALYILHYALKQYVPINLHLANRDLQVQLERCQYKTSEFNAGKIALLEKNKHLQNENLQLRAHNRNLLADLDRLKNIEKIKAKAGFNPVEIDFEGQLIKFVINTDTHTFHEHFGDATNYVFSKRKKHVHLSTIKCWYLEWYRALGFTCVAT
ncbi:MAG TPA: hypothetical protein VN922_17085 [Bacteroidia bacterium]|nr:hypothetical protein [Bacteroidia bacterium]